MSHSIPAGIGSPAPVKLESVDIPKSRPARSAAVPLMGSPSARDNLNRRKSLAQQIESIEQHTGEGDKNVAPIPSIPLHLSPRSPHMRRASRSPKTKSTNMSPSGGTEKVATEVPSISTEELARLLHGGGGGSDGNKSGPPSPKGDPGLSPGRTHSPGRGVLGAKPVTKERSHSVAVAALSEQLKEKEAAVAVPVPTAVRKLTLGGDELAHQGATATVGSPSK